ncbi:MAG: DUF1284 domain-containing protein [Armatimonadetes bacterium]|nr:DUF1284 domain-containing protein [Armatimonadota bacterium]NIM23028.1 DUF1284 domain-containing protein [Armatimonadota bacterium]NIM66896.1 DUF1284 domain-containing protein [Armatimonadota bacterium]NIM75430.1 DUF1284 domain-containing protein [Armatimonadota bacterium]NIN05087.1 DUF1284 domain-containing protein [Armatimonadota bacterium]
MSNTPEMKRLSLRAHHLLCMHGFRGLGYDEHFVENMARVHARVKSEPDLEILVTDEADDICAPCPRNKRGQCERDIMGEPVSARALDHRVLQQLEIDSGRTFSRDDILELVREKITPEDLVSICEGCQWLPFDYCVEGLRRKSLESHG